MASEAAPEAKPEIGTGDNVEVIGVHLHASVREYDGSMGVVERIYNDKGLRMATVLVACAANEKRSGKRFFPVSSLKKLP
jgi:hypothetical protein